MRRLQIVSILAAYFLALWASVPGVPQDKLQETVYGPLLDWKSRANSDSKCIIIEQNGTRQQLRYDWGGFVKVRGNFEAWPSHSYNSTAQYQPPTKAKMPAGILGDPQKGQEIFKSHINGPCAACYAIQDPDAWSLDNVGFDLRTISILVQMQSNGMKYTQDTEHPAVKVAIERGEDLFYR